MDTTTAQDTRIPLDIEETFSGVPDTPTLFEDGRAWRTDLESAKLASKEGLLAEGMKLFDDSRRKKWFEKIENRFDKPNEDFGLALKVGDAQFYGPSVRRRFNRLCTDLSLLSLAAKNCMSVAEDAQAQTQLEDAQTELVKTYDVWSKHFADTVRHGDYLESRQWMNKGGQNTVALGKAAERLSTLVLDLEPFKTHPGGQSSLAPTTNANLESVLPSDQSVLSLQDCGGSSPLIASRRGDHGRNAQDGMDGEDIKGERGERSRSIWLPGQRLRE